MQENKNHICHYTSAEGLIGILNSKQLWATHPRYLNDTGEFNAAFNYILRDKDKIQRIVEDLFGSYYSDQQLSQGKKGPLDFVKSEEEVSFVRDQVRKLISEADQNMSEHIYVTSFANYEGIDSNTHWLSYAHNITGYCIVFDKKDLIENVIEGVNIEFESVYYGETPDEILNKVAKIIYEELVYFYQIAKLSERQGYSLDNEAAIHRAHSFLKMNNLLAMYKQVSYKNELEIRLLVSRLDRIKNNGQVIQEYDSSEFPELNFRISTNGAFVPYQPVPINLNAIKKIIVRSDSHIESKVKSTEMLLKKFDVEAIVEQSTATLRTTL